jgi:DNA adenine methylase
VKSILRYPGGKSKAIDIITPFIPSGFSEFREPFVGGGAVFLHVIQNINPTAKHVINDLNYDLYCFWKHLRDSNVDLYNYVKAIKESEPDGRKLFSEYTQGVDYSEFERAVRFFVLNRITFSGTVDSGGYSQAAFKDRFTYSAIEKILKMPTILSGVEIFNEDYERFLFDSGEDVFIFLDPPYFSQVKSRLYGKKGDLHKAFDHKRFADNMRKCEHKWLITLDDCAENRRLFNFANIYDWELQYGMNNYKSPTAAKGKELFICNYDIPGMTRTVRYTAAKGWLPGQLSLSDGGV